MVRDAYCQSPPKMAFEDHGTKLIAKDKSQIGNCENSNLYLE